MDFTKRELVELLEMPWDRFQMEIEPKAKSVWMEQGNFLDAVAMLGFDNHCRNKCQYCGMSALCKVERYSMRGTEIAGSVREAKKAGFKRIFLVSGENPAYDFDEILETVASIHEMGMHLSLALGELEKEQYRELKDAGCDQYVLKFEFSNPETFARLKPTSDYKKRLQGAEDIKECGMKLASGNIVDFPGHTLDMMADDILLMKKLDITWAPVIPYLPALNTPLAKEGKRGDITKNLKEISILRLMMPEIDLTAQQPGYDLKKGLADDEGNLLALSAGANMLFADMLPQERTQKFSVVDNRITLGLNHISHMADMTGMQLRF